MSTPNRDPWRITVNEEAVEPKDFIKLWKSVGDTGIRHLGVSFKPARTPNGLRTAVLEPMLVSGEEDSIAWMMSPTAFRRFSLRDLVNRWDIDRVGQQAGTAYKALAVHIGDRHLNLDPRREHSVCDCCLRGQVKERKSGRYVPNRYGRSPTPQRPKILIDPDTFVEAFDQGVRGYGEGVFDRIPIDTGAGKPVSQAASFYLLEAYADALCTEPQAA